MTLSVYWSERGVKDGTSPLFGYGFKGGNDGSKQISVRWFDRFTAARQACGYSYAAGAGVGRKLRREVAELYMPDDLDLYCTRAKCLRGETWTDRTAYDRSTLAELPGYPSSEAAPAAGGDTKWKANQFEEAVLDLSFAPADFYLRDDETIDTVYAGNELARYTNYREDRQVKGLVLQGGTMNWILDDGTAGPYLLETIPYGVPRLQFTKTVYIKWFQVAVEAVPWNTIDAMIGHINKTTFLGIYPPDSLLCMAPKVERYVMSNGGIGCDIEFCYEFTPDLQPKLFYSKAGKPMIYNWVTSQVGTGTPLRLPKPTPGSLTDGYFLFNEAEFANAFICSNP